MQKKEMIVLRYSWLFGINGLDKISKLNNQWKQIIAKNYSTSYFNTWLQAQDLITHLEILNLQKGFINNRGVLHLIKSKLQDGNRPLGKIGVDIEEIEIKDDNLSQDTTSMNTALNILRDTDNELFNLYENIIEHIIPLRLKKLKGKAGFSTIDLRGVIFLTIEQEYNNPYEIVIDLVHEIGHQVLFNYQSADPIIENNMHDTELFSSIKQTNRPAIMVFHALVAIAYMKRIVEKLLAKEDLKSFDKMYLKKERVKIDGMLSTTIDVFKGSNLTFTKIGQKIFNEIVLLQKEGELIYA